MAPKLRALLAAAAEAAALLLHLHSGGAAGTPCAGRAQALFWGTGNPCIHPLSLSQAIGELPASPGLLGCAATALAAAQSGSSRPGPACLHGQGVQGLSSFPCAEQH